MLGAANFREIPVTEDIHPLQEHRLDAPLAVAAAGLRR
jgi:hypothetical protein